MVCGSRVEDGSPLCSAHVLNRVLNHALDRDFLAGRGNDDQADIGGDPKGK